MTHTANLINSSLSNEWYTPYDPWIKGVHYVFDDTPDLDPCSNEFAQTWINAKVYWTLQTPVHPFKHKWGNTKNPSKVYLNPPYLGEMPNWVNKTIHEFDEKRIDTAIFLVRGDSAAIRTLLTRSNVWCEPHKRIRFVLPGGVIGDKPIPGYRLFLMTRDIDKAIRFKHFYYDYGTICKRLA